MNKIRIAKKIAESGIASRREAERLILEGKVQVNGGTIVSPVFFVDDTCQITIDGDVINSKSDTVRIWKFHKPVGIITTKRDTKDRTTVFDWLPKIDERLIYIGRLDINTEGLLLFTNSGDVARKAELPSTSLKRTYRARIYGKLNEDNIDELKQGISIGGIKYGPIEITYDNIHKNSANSWVTITLKEGKNREIRKVMNYFSCKVSRLIRLQYGPISLGNLQKGCTQLASSSEVKTFLNSLQK